MRRLGGAPGLVAATAVVTTVCLLPFAHNMLAASTSFLPAVLAVVAAFDVVSVYLLVGDYIDSGDTRLLAMAWAYLWSLVLMLGYAMAFPGVFNGAPLAATPSVGPMLYVGWHAGFPILLGLAWAPWPQVIERVTPRPVRRWHALLSSLVVVAVAVGVVALIVTQIRHLPVLSVNGDTHRSGEITGPFAVPLVVLALIATVRGAWHRLGPERWVTVTVLVCLCDLVLTYVAGHKFSLGWYSGRALTLVGAGVVTVAMLSEFRRIKREAEQGAATDPLTGLPNRRALEVALTSELDRAARRGSVTSVLLLDLDGFKKLNDTQGHAAGDAVLCEAAKLWADRLRMGDVLARLGGDEFVAVLPDTNYMGATAVAAKLAESTPDGVGVSVGVGIAAGGDLGAAGLLHAADADMYDVKARRHAQSDQAQSDQAQSDQAQSDQAQSDQAQAHHAVSPAGV